MSQIYDVLGVDPDNDNHETPQHELGQRAKGPDGAEYVYAQADAGGVTGAGYVVLFDENWSADMIDTTNSASALGQLVGVAMAAITASYYGWFQVRGTAQIRVTASATANTALHTFTTAGVLDDAGTSGAEQIDGIILTTANGASVASAAGVLDDPRVGATL